jgi:hypothetical protein
MQMGGNNGDRKLATSVDIVDIIPTRRRIYRRQLDGQPILDNVIEAIDLHEIKVN